jgi:hypothetical protein
MADTLAWLIVLVQWSSMIEAPIAMGLEKRSDPN